jgi:enoyl-CoA hydratase/carnithine racemase
MPNTAGVSPAEHDGASLVDYRTEEGIALITLNRPDKRNAINLPFAESLAAALDRLASDDSARAAVLSGTGKGFCSGGDITMFPALDTQGGLDFVRGIGERIHQSIARSRKPILAAVHGFCLAGGFEIALACHVIYASEETRFAMREIRLGLIPGWGGTVRLARATSPGFAMDLLLTGRTIDAKEAKATGIVARVFADESDCKRAAMDAAKTIAGAPRLATESVISVVRAAQNLTDDAFSLEQASVAMLFGSDETQQKITETLRTGIGR